MNPYLISQLAADRHAERLTAASQQRLARQARSTRRSVVRTEPGRSIRPLRLAIWLRARLAA